MSIIKKTTNKYVGEGCGEKGTLIYCWWECKLMQPLWKISEVPQNVLNRTTSMIRQIHFWIYTQSKLSSDWKRYQHSNARCSIIQTRYRNNSKFVCHWMNKYRFYLQWYYYPAMKKKKSHFRQPSGSWGHYTEWNKSGRVNNMKLSQLHVSFPDGTVDKESTCQARGHNRCRFDPWVKKYPWEQ